MKVVELSKHLKSHDEKQLFFLRVLVQSKHCLLFRQMIKKCFNFKGNFQIASQNEFKSMICTICQEHPQSLVGSWYRYKSQVWIYISKRFIMVRRMSWNKQVCIMAPFHN